MSTQLLANQNSEEAPSDRITVQYNAETQTTTIDITDLSLYLNTKREFYWTISFLIVSIVFIAYDIGSNEQSDNTTISILVILCICAICSLTNFISLIIYYCCIVDSSNKKCIITISRQESTVMLQGHGFWNKFICGCLFGRSIYLNSVTLKNAFVQYRLMRGKNKKCGFCVRDSLWFYIRGYDEMLNVSDKNNQIDVESEVQTLCRQRWNQATVNILKNVLTYDERKWVVLYIIKHSYCAVLKSVDNISDEYGLILPSEYDRVVDL